MSEPRQESGLEVLESPSTGVLFRGERLEIRPLTIGQIPRLLRTAQPVVDAIIDSTVLVGDDIDEGLLGFVMTLLADHGEAVIDALAIITGKSREYIAEGDLAESAELAMKVAKVNRDFFDQRLGPLLRRALNGEAAADGTGSTPSRSSAIAATH